MQLPKKITPCPILETIVEIRFDITIPVEVFFGLLYDALKDTYKTFEKLPILQVPEEIRSKDPNLIFQPVYRLKDHGFVIACGPKIISISSVPEYAGWEIYYPRIISAFDKVKKLNFFSKINRLGVRYVNFFPGDIFENIKLQISHEKLKFKDDMYFRTNILEGKFKNILQIANNTTVKQNNQMKRGSIIDIDTSVEGPENDIYNHLNDLINEEHAQEKKLFFSLLTEDFLSKLNPEY